MDLHRPMVKPGLRRVWRGPRTLQLGVDVPTPLLLDPVDDAVHALLQSMDGRLPLTDVLAVARRAGLTGADAEQVLRRLLDAGLLADAGVPDPDLAALPRAERDRLAGDLQAAGLADPRPDAAVVALRSRRALSVLVLGGDRFGGLLAQRLREAGVGQVARPGHDQLPDTRLAESPVVADAQRPGCATTGESRVVVVPAAVARMHRRQLGAAPFRHLVTEVGETVVRLGPLVDPGRTACFTCLELTRLDRDPGWAPVSAQLATAAPVAGATPLLEAAAALAVLHLLDWATGGRPPELDGVVEVALPHGQPVRRACPPHPACGCGWPAGAGSRPQ